MLMHFVQRKSNINWVVYINSTMKEYILAQAICVANPFFTCINKYIMG